uniref:Uncharacterized protein n=1 Tax=Aggregatibacter actinomycetemcomitans TaxID=714 RepID=Q8RQ56_AGGAC|nr:unknown [Aggregatibacter actinomycetemcomitans]
MTQKRQYSKLKDSTKKLIGDNANTYSKANYKQILLKLRPEVATAFDDVCAAEGIQKQKCSAGF